MYQGIREQSKRYWQAYRVRGIICGFCGLGIGVTDIGFIAI